MMKQACAGCHKGFEEVPTAPMLTDEAWAKFAGPKDQLCAECFFGRARDRRIDLTLADLLPCPFNLFPSPRSWFDLFLSLEKDEPPNIAEWRTAMIALLVRSPAA
jgi:hypothetical protein